MCLHKLSRFVDRENISLWRFNALKDCDVFPKIWYFAILLVTFVDEQPYEPGKYQKDVLNVYMRFPEQ